MRLRPISGKPTEGLIEYFAWPWVAPTVWDMEIKTPIVRVFADTHSFGICSVKKQLSVGVEQVQAAKETEDVCRAGYSRVRSFEYAFFFLSV